MEAGGGAAVTAGAACAFTLAPTGSRGALRPSREACAVVVGASAASGPVLGATTARRPSGIVVGGSGLSLGSDARVPTLGG